MLFCFNDTATTEIYTLSLHDALPICEAFFTASLLFCVGPLTVVGAIQDGLTGDYEALATKALLDGFASIALAASLGPGVARSEEHTSELQSRQYLVCCLLLEKTNR